VAPRRKNDAAERHFKAVEDQRAFREEIRSLTRETIETRLIAFGLEESDRGDLQADLRHLRWLRKRAEQVQGFVRRAAITGLLTGVVGLVWLGLKSAMGR